MVRFDRWMKLVDIDDVLGAVGLYRKGTSGAGTFLFGVGLGLVGGAAAALLLTPYNGGEAREKLVRGAEDISRTVTSKVGELTHKLQGETESNILASGTGNGTFSQGTRVGSV